VRRWAVHIVTGLQILLKLSTKSVKFIYSEKATKFGEIFALLLTRTTYDKSKVKILQNFVAFSEYMNFNYAKWVFECKDKQDQTAFQPE
jgi:hypothetical protein